MQAPSDRIFAFAPNPVSKSEFIRFWARAWAKMNSRDSDKQYDLHIRTPENPESLCELFRWKGGERFRIRDCERVERVFVPLIEKARHLKTRQASAADWAEEFPTGGAILRIFWMHCWEPDRFPIFDQHVYRAMTFIEDGKCLEPPSGDRAKMEIYLGRYIPFYAGLQGDTSRQVDHALWSFGKFIKRCPFPLPQ
jgi:hypothetical protein